MGNRCCGFGHREIYQSISSNLQKLISDLICNKNVDIFYTGRIGDFDNLFSSAVRKEKKYYKDVKLILVKPYFSSELNKNKEFYESNYDSIIIPSKLMGAYYKSAIKLRNRWLVNNSDIVISCVYRNFGGAYTVVKYAERMNKEIVKLL